MAKREDQICTKCQSISTGVMRGSGSIELALLIVGILSAFILIPLAFIYSGWRKRGGYSNCPKCHGENTMIPLSTPAAQLLTAGSTPTAIPLAVKLPEATPVPPTGEAKPATTGRFLVKVIAIVGVMGLISIFSSGPEPSRVQVNPGSNIATPAKTEVLSPAQNALLDRALADCKSAIANNFGASGSGMIPDVDNHGATDKDEFYYAWPRGSYRLSTALGTVDMSASCTGSIRSGKIDWLTINAKDVIVNGRKRD